MSRLAFIVIRYIKNKIKLTIAKVVLPIIKSELNAFQFTEIKIFGDPSRLILKGNNITVNNTFFNCNSGTIVIEDHVGIAHNCMVVTGSHDFGYRDLERSNAILQERDIHIEQGVFIGVGSVILGPCRIGKHSVIGAGSVVNSDIPENVIAFGNPCKVIRPIKFKNI